MNYQPQQETRQFQNALQRTKQDHSAQISPIQGFSLAQQNIVDHFKKRADNTMKQQEETGIPQKDQAKEILSLKRRQMKLIQGRQDVPYHQGQRNYGKTKNQIPGEKQSKNGLEKGTKNQNQHRSTNKKNNQFQIKQEVFEKRKKVAERCPQFYQRIRAQMQKDQIRPSQNNQGQKRDSNKAIQKQVSECKIERLPCSFCDKLLTFQELDQHHRSCQMAFHCELCQDFFPLAFINEHSKICKKKGNKIAIQKQLKHGKKEQLKHGKREQLKHGKREQLKHEQREQLKHEQREQLKHVKREQQKKQKAFKAEYYVNQEQLEQAKFFSLYPDIDPQILRQHLKAEKKKELNKKQRQIRQDHSFNKQHPWLGQDHLDYGFSLQRQFQFKPRQIRNNDRSAQNQQNLVNYPRSSQNSRETESEEGLKEYQVKRLITDYYVRGQNKEEDQCSICTKEKEEGDLIIRLPCFHTYHKDCIVPWLKVKSVCPNCKFDLKTNPK